MNTNDYELDGTKSETEYRQQIAADDIAAYLVRNLLDGYAEAIGDGVTGYAISLPAFAYDGVNPDSGIDPGELARIISDYADQINGHPDGEVPLTAAEAKPEADLLGITL